MATTSKLLQLRPKLNPKPNFSHLLYSSSSSNSKDTQIPPPPQEPLSEPPAPTPTSKPFSFSSIAANNTQNHSSSSSLDDISRMLAGYRRRNADSSSTPPPPPPPPLSLHELHKINVNSESHSPPSLDFKTLRQHLGKLRENNSSSNYQNENRGKLVDLLSLSSLKDSLKLRPNENQGSRMVIGGSEKLPVAIFGKEMARDKIGNKEVNMMGFVTTYGHEELGEKLKKLRPGKKEFSLQELNERLLKVMEIDEKEKGTKMFGDIKGALLHLQQDSVDKRKKPNIQRLGLLEHLGGTPSFMLHPPKEHLVEKYFHPDNMSSEEKMKLELQKVRDEFKMSESDCGSFRVQVAQLTTKIKHLSTVLHKKDKHSRKGLQAMVQKRKKLLKYLRRTDWDSYCLVLSKLGLRDNPDYKF